MLVLTLWKPSPDIWRRACQIVGLPLDTPPDSPSRSISYSGSASPSAWSLKGSPRSPASPITPDSSTVLPPAAKPVVSTEPMVPSQAPAPTASALPSVSVAPAAESPANLNPDAGIELVSDDTIRSMGDKAAPKPYRWHLGDEFPEFQKLAWTDLERLYDMFDCNVSKKGIVAYEYAPEPLVEFQNRLHQFARIKTEQIKAQVEAIPAHLHQLSTMSDEKRENLANGVRLQQNVEDRLTVGEKPAVALRALRDG